MIRLNVVCSGGHREEFISHDAIARISEAGALSQWYGIRCIVHTFDSKVLECADTAREVAAAVDAATRKGE